MAILDKRKTKIYPVISELRKYSAKNNDSCTVTGLTSVGDGKGGDFVFDYYSELADDGINIVAPTGLTQGRWLRVNKSARLDLSNLSSSIPSQEQEVIRGKLGIIRDDTISYALSSPSADLTTGDTDSFLAPYNFTLDNYFAGVAEAPSGSSLVIGLKKNGTSVTSSNAIIDSGEISSLTGTNPTITISSFVKGDVITPVISQVGSLDTGKSLKIYLEITKT